MVPDQTVDVNALMTALTQASAALIAIVGGLLVSRYVTLHAEQQGAQRRLDDIDRRLTASKESHAQAVRARDVFVVDDLLEDERVYEEILNREFKPTVQEVLAALDHDGDGLNREVLSKRLTDLVQEVTRAGAEMIDLVPEATHHDEWAKFRREHEFNVGHKDAWEWIYDRICKDQRAAAKATKAAAAKASARGPFATALTLGLFDAPDLPLVTASFWSDGTNFRAIRDRLRKQINEADAEVRALTHERALVQETFDATRQPEGFNLALHVLSLLAVLGMGLPVAVMAIPLTSLPTWARVLVVLGVGLGVGLLLRYLFVYAAYLKGARPALPKSMLGLVPRPRWPRR